MLMTMRVEMAPGGDLGFLLEKHPDRLQSRDTTFGCAYVFYPQVEPTFAQVALLLDVDPVKLVRGTPTSVSGGLLEDYVNDRPYSAASFMAVALKAVFASAMKGESRARPELAPQAFPLEIHFPSLSVRGRVGVIHDWFEPLGYYGPEYALPGNIERIRPRKVGHKRSMAFREFFLGLEALRRFVANDPLYRVHQCVFGVLAMETEPVDPRL